LSKAFNLIYFSISSALRFQVQKQPKERVLKTYLFNKILNMAEQKKNAQHIIKDFNRPSKVSISVKSQIISKDIFKINTDHFMLSKACVLSTITKQYKKNYLIKFNLYEQIQSITSYCIDPIIQCLRKRQS